MPLDKPDAIRIGQKKIRRGTLAYGLFALLLALSLMGLHAARAMESVQWIQHEPLSWLIRDAQRPLGAAALTEIDRRYIAGNMLTTKEVSELIELGLRIQIDPAQTWSPYWGKWIEAEHAAGRLSTLDWRRYAVNLLGPATLTPTPSSITRGSRFTTTVNFSSRRCAPNSTLRVKLDDQSYRCLVNGDSISPLEALPIESDFPAAMTLLTGNRIDWLLSRSLGRLTDGEQKLRVQSNVLVIEEIVGGSIVLSKAPIDVSANVGMKTVSPGKVAIVHDPALRKAIEAAINIQACRVPGVVNGDYLWVRIDADKLPTAVAFQVCCLIGDRATAVGHVTAEPNQGIRSSFMKASSLFSTSSLTVSMTPSVTSARSASLPSVWDGGLLFFNVEVVAAKVDQQPHSNGPL